MCKKRIGILGGSFDPIHHGHLLMAELARQFMSLDQVIFMPAAVSPFKSGQKSSSAKDRLAMVRVAIKGNHYFSVSDLELKRQGPSYTIDTLLKLKSLNPNTELFWIIGHDHVYSLKKWKDFPRIIQLASFIAVSRDFFNISSSEIRAMIKLGSCARYMVPDLVLRYIIRRRLYV